MDLRQRKRKGLQEHPDEHETPSSKTKRMRKYREKLKTDPERKTKYEETLKKDRERKRKEREKEKINKSGDRKQQEKDREKWRMAQRAYRQKQKDKCSQDKTPSTDPEPKIPKPQTTPNPQKTSNKHDSGSLKKQKAVLRTQRWRMRLKLKMAGKPKSSKLRQAGKNNDSECVSADDEAISSTENQIETASNSNDKATGQTPFRSRSTEWRSTQKAKKALPNTPRRKAKVIENLMNIPDVKKNLESKGVINSEKARKQLKMGMTALNNIKSKLKELKIKRGTAEKERQNTYKKIYHAVVGESKYNLGSALTSYLGLNRKRRPKSPERPPAERRRKDWWKDVPRNPRKDKTSSQIKDQVHGFFLSPDVSREVPNKKDVLKVNGESVNRHVMTMTMQEAHEKFCKENKEIKIGLTAFKKLKPAQVRRVSETSHKSCLCQICCNLSLKIEALQKFALEKENEGLKSEVKNWNKTRLGDITLCEYQNYPKLECLNRSCQHCTVKSLSEKVKDTISDHHDDIITYYEWKPITVESENGSKRVTSCVKENCSMKDFILKTEDDLEKYPAHIFRANWQHRQMQLSIENMKQGDVVMLMDYSENYKCRFQNESQNAFFEQRQVTIHPFMCYYFDQAETDQKKLVKHSIIAVSDDTRHDAHAVQVFENKATEILESQNVTVDRIHKFSDGAAAQYKGKNSFLQLSQSKIPVIRNYFETSHGKSPCDGLGAVVKNTCWNAVKCGKTVIGSAEDVFQYCQKLDHGPIEPTGKNFISKRNVFFVSSKEIKREPSTVKTLQGTRVLHSLKNTGTRNELKVRTLSCYCLECIDDGETSCQNTDYVEPWLLKKLTFTGTNCQSENEDTRGTSNSESRCSFKIGDYVSVRLVDHRRRKSLHIAKISQIDFTSEEVELQYLEQEPCSTPGKYKWPKRKDVSWEPISSIIDQLTDPVLLPGRGLFLQFDKPQILSCIDKL